MSKFATKIFSIEADERLSNIAKKKFSKFENIKIINGVSQNILEQILREEKFTKNLCFYLDAHLCMDHITNKKTYGMKSSETPILKELKLIENEIMNYEKINIIIDDIRLFGSNFENYPSLDVLVEWSKMFKSKWQIQHDMFIIQYENSH